MTKHALLKIAGLASGIAMVAQPTFAGLLNWSWGRGDGGCATGTTYAVPEIDASSGLLALAAVGAVLLFAWERRRNA